MSLARLAAPRRVSGEWLSPRPRPVSWIESVLIVLAAVLIAFPRGGSDAFRGVIWAEDGAVFLDGAYADHGGWSALLSPYAGYGHVVPRLLAALVDLFPVAWHGVLICLAATLVQALVALFAFHVVRSHSRGRVAALLTALAVAAVPVGVEVWTNIANLQWFLLFAGCLSALWEPRTAVGRGASILVLAGCALSCPFGGVAVAIAGLVWWLTRRRDLFVLLVVGAVCELVQLTVIATAPPRQTAGHAWWNPFDLLAAYVRRVLGDAVLGTGRLDWDEPARAVLPGLLVLAALVTLGYVAWRLAGSRATTVTALLMVVSLVTFVIPVGLTGIVVGAPFWVAGSGRYYVTPALLVLVVAGLFVERIVVPGAADATGPGHAARAHAPIWAQVLAWSVVAAIGFGLVTSYREPTQFRTGVTPSWSSQVRSARDLCASDPGLDRAGIEIAPDGWSVSIPCDRLAGR